MVDTSITIDLPVLAVEQLQQTAHQQRRSVSEVVRDLVLRELPVLPPLPEDVENELSAFAFLSDDVLWLLARSTLAPDQQRELARLDEEAQRHPLSEQDEARQQTLIDAYDRMLVRRAQAAAALKARGYDLSDIRALQPDAAA